MMTMVAMARGVRTYYPPSSPILRLLFSPSLRVFPRVRPRDQTRPGEFEPVARATKLEQGDRFGTPVILERQPRVSPVLRMRERQLAQRIATILVRFSTSVSSSSSSFSSSSRSFIRREKEGELPPLRILGVRKTDNGARVGVVEAGRGVDRPRIVFLLLLLLVPLPVHHFRTVRARAISGARRGCVRKRAAR